MKKCPSNRSSARQHKALTRPLFLTTLPRMESSFYWQCLRPGGSEVPVSLRARIEADFGSIDACKKELADAAVTQFASGWAWLVLEDKNV
jgi:superoxide dismutase